MAGTIDFIDVSIFFIGVEKKINTITSDFLSEVMFLLFRGHD
jgi:hypothetical protein